MANQAQKDYIKKLSARATQIQKAGGTTTKTITQYKMNRSDAVSKAAKEIKAQDALNKMNKK